MTAPSTQSTTQNTTLEEALQHISAEAKVWVRVAAVRQDDGTWNERLLELTSGAAPPSFEQRCWEYPAALFAAAVVSGAVAAGWLQGGSIALGDERRVVVPGLVANSRPTWQHRQSHEPAPYETLFWPSTDASFSQNDLTSSEPQGHLVSGGDAPSFVNFYTAAACFFWFDRRPSGGAVNQGTKYRHQDTTGRINKIRFGDNSLAVDVEGDNLADMTVELAGEAPGMAASLAGDRLQTVTFPLDGGLPPGAWVLLRRGCHWVDRRFLTGQWAGAADHGVEYLVDPQTRLEAFLAEREGPQVEFKRQISDTNKAKIMKTVCAFANESGGSVLFGIDDDNDHDLVGIEAQRVDRMKDQLTQSIDSWVEPPPAIAFQTLPIDAADNVVLELQVRPGSALYGSGRPGETKTVYVRRHAVTVKAKPSEIEAIIRSRSTTTTSIPGFAWA